MLHESPHYAARCHALHLLHILEPYGPNRWQSSRIFPHPCALDDMKPPPWPGIPLRHFGHFPATKEGARSDRHAEKLFKLPPAYATDRNAPGFGFAACRRTSSPAPASRSTCQDHAHHDPHCRPFVLPTSSHSVPTERHRRPHPVHACALFTARQIVNAYNYIGRRTDGPRIASQRVREGNAMPSYGHIATGGPIRLQCQLLPVSST